MICRLFFWYYKLQLYYERRMKVNVLQFFTKHENYDSIGWFRSGVITVFRPIILVVYSSLSDWIRYSLWPAWIWGFIFGLRNWRDCKPLLIFSRNIKSINEVIEVFQWDIYHPETVVDLIGDYFGYGYFALFHPIW